MKETGLKDCNDPQLMDAISKAYALNVVKEIQEKSPILK